MFALYFMFISCSEKDDQQPVEENQEENHEEGQEEDQTEGQEEGTDESEGAHAFCTPQPNIQNQDLGFDVFQKFTDVEALSCFLNVREVDTNNDGENDSSEEFTAPTECEDENNCIQTLPGFAVSWAQSSLYISDPYRHGSLSEGIVEGERVRVNGTETIHLRISYHTYGNTAEREIERIYSSEGNMLEERFYFNGGLWFEVFNTWEDQLLVEQDAYDHINSNGVRTSLSWNYDNEGRMIESVYAPANQQINTASFVYDEEGRLVALTRDVDGEIFLSQSWSYENGELIARSSEYLPSAQWHTSADNARGQTVWDHFSHWDSSTSTTNDNCTTLPFSILHGYPDEEKVYQLGWQLSDVPNNIGFSYRYDGYGWNYGTQSWFGHMGIASIYDTAEWEASAMRKNTITYQNGRMTTEVITMANEEDSQQSITRNRIFEGELIQTDEVINSFTGTESSPGMYTLDFSYDERGNIQTRQLFQDEVLTHHNTWTYNEVGSLTGHDISMLLAQNDELTLVASYRQTTTEDDDSYVRIREKRNGSDGTWEMVDQLRRGEHERGRYEINDHGYVVFDDDNQIVMQGYGDLENPTYYCSAVENQDGLLERWTHREYDDITVSHYQHVCE